MSCIFVWQEFEKDSLKAEALAPLGAIGLRQLAGEDCLARRLGLLSGSRVPIVFIQIKLSWLLVRV